MMQQQANDPGTKMPAELLALMRRYNDLGLLLPRAVDEEELADLPARISTELILKEMEAVLAQIHAFIAAARANG
jgi:hypothetical protein